MIDFSKGAQALDRGSPLPLWAQLESELRRRLGRCDFTERFPTDHELTTIYEVSRHTARHAVDRLYSDGIVSRERGRGTTVNKEHFEQSLGALYSLFHLVEAQGAEQRSEVIALEVTTDEVAAHHLGLGPNAKLVHLARVRFAGEEPLAIDKVWMPESVARPLLDSDFSRTSLYEEMERVAGTHPTEGSERIRPTALSVDDCHLLGLLDDTAAFSVERTSGNGDQALEWRVTLIRGDRFSFFADWTAGSTGALRLTPSGA